MAKANGRARSDESIHVRLSFTRAAKAWYRYECPDVGAVITALYIRKSAFGEAPPSWLVLLVEPSKTFSGPRAETEAQ